MEPIFLEPIFKERIWGGTKLHDEFGYSIPSNHTGECWGVSAHSHGQSIVKSGSYQGLTLGELWEKERELFGNYSAATFPLLTKVLDAKTDLSVQVHPDDEYASTYENGELGKTECWYVIDCEEGAEIVFGHNAATKQQFIEMVDRGEWQQLLKRVKVKPGDFFYVPSGTIHAIGAGVLILETQQSSDTTYRVYDYDRVEANGQKRELHIEKTIDVTTIPHQDTQLKKEVHQFDGGKVTTYVKEDYFSVYKWDVSSEFSYDVNEHFLICSVISGNGEISTAEGNFALLKGDHFILPNGVGEVKVRGSVELIVSHP